MLYSSFLVSSQKVAAPSSLESGLRSRSQLSAAWSGDVLNRVRL